MSIERAMVLAAGRGERMRPLTDQVPKPLLSVRGKPLIVYHLEKLQRLGVKQVVINLAWLGEQVRAALGDGARWGLQILYSDEGQQALETGGGILQALPLLGPQPFLVLNADVFTEFDFSALQLAPEALAQLVLVANPMHHPRGDFALINGRVQEQGGARWTYSGIGLYRPELFAGCSPGKFPLLPLLRRAIAGGRLYGQVFDGVWNDVGSVERLAALQ
ncbi:MAG TPA: nucleotidyltransferase family protein [Steroidobacteraceae bacterium]|nr:nucleotidyltransferase family protein [Steroidobacteraceae bacterium]